MGFVVTLDSALQPPNCAASLREPLMKIARLYEDAGPQRGVSISFGASSVLAAQLRAGAPIDVLIAADERIVDDLEARGLLAPSQRFALVHAWPGTR